MPTKSISSIYVATVTVSDPDTNAPVDVEVRKLATGPMVGFDASYLEQLGDEEQPNSPYDDGVKVVVPDNEASRQRRNTTVNATYTSVWDNGTKLSSPCQFDTQRKVCSKIESRDADVGSAQLEREYITLADGSELDEENGVIFNT